jgi:hypothetical protein
MMTGTMGTHQASSSSPSSRRLDEKEHHLHAAAADEVIDTCHCAALVQKMMLPFHRHFHTNHSARVTDFSYARNPFSSATSSRARFDTTALWLKVVSHQTGKGGLMMIHILHVGCIDQYFLLFSSSTPPPLLFRCCWRCCLLSDTVATPATAATSWSPAMMRLGFRSHLVSYHNGVYVNVKKIRQKTQKSIVSIPTAHTLAVQHRPWVGQSRRFHLFLEEKEHARFDARVRMTRTCHSLYLSRETASFPRFFFFLSSLMRLLVCLLCLLLLLLLFELPRVKAMQHETGGHVYIETRRANAILW